MKSEKKELLKKIIKLVLFIFYFVFVLALVICGIIFGIMTLIPDDASKPCYLGYYAHCSFTPFSTIILFAMTLVGLILLIKIKKYLKELINNMESEKQELLKKNIKLLRFLFYFVFVLALIICGIIFGIMTLIPDDAKKPCYLGYYAHCSFTPFSTIILFAITLIGLILLIKIIKDLKKK